MQAAGAACSLPGLTGSFRRNGWLPGPALLASAADTEASGAGTAGSRCLKPTARWPYGCMGWKLRRCRRPERLARCRGSTGSSLPETEGSGAGTAGSAADTEASGAGTAGSLPEAAGSGAGAAGSEARFPGSGPGGEGAAAWQRLARCRGSRALPPRRMAPGPALLAQQPRPKPRELARQAPCPKPTARRRPGPQVRRSGSQARRRPELKVRRPERLARCRGSRALLPKWRAPGPGPQAQQPTPKPREPEQDSRQR